MHRHEDRHFLPYAPEDLFDLVADVEKYPQFLPWCSAARVEAPRQDAEGRTFFDAELAVSYNMLEKRFVSRVFADRPRLRIDIAYLRGPFRHLSNHWQFSAASQDGQAGTQVDFFIEFDFRSGVFGALMTPIFVKATERMTEALAQRAEALYGRK